VFLRGDDLGTDVDVELGLLGAAEPDAVAHADARVAGQLDWNCVTNATGCHASSACCGDPHRPGRMIIEQDGGEGGHAGRSSPTTTSPRYAADPWPSRNPALGDRPRTAHPGTPSTAADAASRTRPRRQARFRQHAHPAQPTQPETPVTSMIVHQPRTINWHDTPCQGRSAVI